MKKLIALTLVAAALMLAATPAKALGDPYPKGTFIAGAYAGVLPGFGAALTGDYTIMNIWKGHLTGGLMTTWNRYPKSDFDIDVNFNDFDDYSIGYTTKKTYFNRFGIAPRVTYGLNITDAFEVHLGLSIGIGIAPGQEHPLAFCVGDVAGLRYFFTDNLAVSFEVSPLIAIGWQGTTWQYFSTAANVGVNFLF